MGVCNFYTELSNQVMGLEKLSELFSLVTGIETSPEDLQKIGRRIYHLERQFLVREGITKKDDYMQGTRVRTPIANGPFKGEYLDDKRFTVMLEQYYALRGWDRDTGAPLLATLKEFGLDDEGLVLMKKNAVP